MITLSPKALARWTWQRGHAWTDDRGASGSVHKVYEDGLIIIFTGEHSAVLLRISLPHSIPDLSDEVTADSLPRVVRKAWACPGAYAWSRKVLPRGADEVEIHWVVEIRAGVQFFAPTEAEAWIKALEAAP